MSSINFDILLISYNLLLRLIVKSLMTILYYYHLLSSVCLFVSPLPSPFCRVLLTAPQPILYALHAALCLLPVGWSVGLLPPIDALLFWLMEQALIHLMGGSPMASEAR